MIVMGLDPGVTNFGIAVNSISAKAHKPVWAGKFKHTIRQDMQDLPAQFAAFEEEMRGLLARYKPSIIAIERFMNRGKFSGDQGEFVSMMLALTIRLAVEMIPSVQVVIVQPGNWKTELNRMYAGGGKVTREKGKRTTLEVITDYCLTEPHELDAYFMTFYAYCKQMDLPPFEMLKGKAGGKSLIHAFEAVATGKKKRARK